MEDLFYHSLLSNLVVGVVGMLVDLTPKFAELGDGAFLRNYEVYRRVFCRTKGLRMNL